tara:strand:+ start:1750 stop:2403 length:654 start_codon:yes stop_codon:yes gene_type:complete
MPKFPENKGFKLPGLSSREIDTPDNFREDQGAKDVGYCDNTEFSMLPAGSSPLAALDLDSYVPEYYRTSYTKTSWPRFSKKSKGKSECEDSQTKHPETGKCVGKVANMDTQVDTETDNSEKTNVRKTWKQAWTDNDENVKDKYKSYKDYVADRSGQQKADPEGYEKDLVQKTGVSGGPGTVTTKGESTTKSEYKINGKSVTKAAYCAARPNDSRCIK